MGFGICNRMSKSKVLDVEYSSSDSDPELMSLASLLESQSLLLLSGVASIESFMNTATVVSFGLTFLNCSGFDVLEGSAFILIATLEIRTSSSGIPSASKHSLISAMSASPMVNWYRKMANLSTFCKGLYYCS